MEAFAADEKNDSEKLHDTLQFLLETHLELTKKKISEIVASYKRQRGGEGLNLAISLVTKAANCGDNYVAFTDDLEQYFPESIRNTNMAAEATYKHFLIFAQHASGNIDDADPLFIQAKQLSSLDSQKLKQQIGVYFKQETTKFISEEYQQDSALNSAAEAAANDNSDPSLSPSPKRRAVNRDSSETNEGRF